MNQEKKLIVRNTSSICLFVYFLASPQEMSELSETECPCLGVIANMHEHLIHAIWIGDLIWQTQIYPFHYSELID